MLSIYVVLDTCIHPEQYIDSTYMQVHVYVYVCTQKYYVPSGQLVCLNGWTVFNLAMSCIKFFKQKRYVCGVLPENRSILAVCIVLAHMLLILSAHAQEGYCSCLCVCVCLLSHISPLERLLVLKILSRIQRAKILGVFSENAPLRRSSTALLETCMSVSVPDEILKAHCYHYKWKIQVENTIFSNFLPQSWCKNFFFTS